MASDSAEAAAEIQRVSAIVISSVQGLALEAEKMVKFIDEIALDGYRALGETCEEYSSDAGKFHEMMTEFLDNAMELEKSIGSIQEAVQVVGIAVEESAKGVVNVSEMSVGLSGSVDDIGKEAGENKKIAELLSNEVHRFKLE